jgi:oxaloacetate decarboxylase alpha subunit
MEKGKAELGDKAKSIEDVLSYILFPQVALEFFRQREEAASQKAIDASAVSKEIKVKSRFGKATYLFEHWGQ